MTEERFFLARVGKHQEWGIVERGTPIGNRLFLPVPDRALAFAKKVVRRLNGEDLVSILGANE